ERPVRPPGADRARPGRHRGGDGRALRADDGAHPAPRAARAPVHLADGVPRDAGAHADPGRGAAEHRGLCAGAHAGLPGRAGGHRAAPRHPRRRHAALHPGGPAGVRRHRAGRDARAERRRAGHLRHPRRAGDSRGLRLRHRGRRGHRGGLGGQRVRGRDGGRHPRSSPLRGERRQRAPHRRRGGRGRRRALSRAGAPRARDVQRGGLGGGVPIPRPLGEQRHPRGGGHQPRHGRGEAARAGRGGDSIPRAAAARVRRRELGPGAPAQRHGGGDDAGREGLHHRRHRARADRGEQGGDAGRRPRRRRGGRRRPPRGAGARRGAQPGGGGALHSRRVRGDPPPARAHAGGAQRVGELHRRPHPRRGDGPWL
ncbi:MAG: Phage baseplate, partial [uncultured Gemmatimonadetes bacterium]